MCVNFDLFKVILCLLFWSNCCDFSPYSRKYSQWGKTMEAKWIEEVHLMILLVSAFRFCALIRLLTDINILLVSYSVWKESVCERRFIQYYFSILLSKYHSIQLIDWKNALSLSLFPILWLVEFKDNNLSKSISGDKKVTDNDKEKMDLSILAICYKKLRIYSCFYLCKKRSKNGITSLSLLFLTQE